MTNRCTLLIDGNWLLISRFSVMTNLFLKSHSEAELQVATEKLKDMMARSINVILNRLPMIDNIIFISDGGSWRKQLPIPKQLDDIAYKGNRTHNAEVSMSHVFKALNDISKICESRGITTCNQNNIEGDDWIWYWSRKLNAQGTHCIIWSSDHDLMQLVQSCNDSFTSWLYDRSNKTEFVCHESLEIKEPDPDDLDFFMRPMQFKPRILEDIEKKITSAQYIDPNTIINGKIICGDSGDNIKSVARIIKNGRTYGVGPKDWEKAAKQMHIASIQDLLKKREEIATYIASMKKFDNKINWMDILEMIDYNIKLVWLNESTIPETIVAVMNQHDYNIVDVNYFRGSYKTLLEDNTEIQDIFFS